MVGRRPGLGDPGHRLRPLLRVPGLLRGPARGARLVARGHRGGVLDLVGRAGRALAHDRDPRGPPGPAPRHARRGVPARRRVCAVEPDRLVVVPLPDRGRAGGDRAVRGELGAERDADRAVVHRAAEQHAGLAFSGMGAGVLVMGPLAQWLITGHGWRAAYVVLGVGTLVVLVPLIWFGVREAPIVTAPARAAAEPTPAPARRAVGDALPTGTFWALFFAYLCTPLAVFSVVTHSVAFAVDHGFPRP